MISLFCNFCKTSFVNNNNKIKLDNYMFNIHNIDIKLFEIMKRKRYINWMKYAILHVITIRDSFSKREYIIIQTSLYDEINEAIFVCIDTSFNVNFIDEFLFSKNQSLWNILHNCHSIIIRDIASERIVDRQINISLFFIATNDSIKRINFKIYVNKSIQTNVILNINELNKKENNIVLWLNRKKMQLIIITSSSISSLKIIN